MEAEESKFRLAFQPTPPGRLLRRPDNPENQKAWRSSTPHYAPDRALGFTGLKQPAVARLIFRRH